MYITLLVGTPCNPPTNQNSKPSGPSCARAFFRYLFGLIYSPLSIYETYGNYFDIYYPYERL